MDVALWVLSGVLAVVFFLAGVMKVASSKDKLIESGQWWAVEFSTAAIKAIGVAEIIGAVGLVLPELIDVAAWLTPTAALALAALILGAVAVHLRRREVPNALFNVVLVAGLLLVALGRV